MRDGMSKLTQDYTARKAALQRAASKLASTLKAIAATIEDKDLVRAQVRSLRIKKLSSIRAKARRNAWPESRAMSNCRDLVGARVVCNNVADVYRFVELLKERFQGGDIQTETQDQIATPNESGYRALHFNVGIDVGASPFERDFVQCEVQVRTLLQDAWAELVHHDIYKQPQLPEDLRARAKDLAENLAAADKIAGEIRARATREIAPPHKRPDLSRVAPETLAFIFSEVFGRSPPDYAVRVALADAQDLGIASLEKLLSVLQRVPFRESLAAAYTKIMPVGAGNEDIFLASLRALAGDDRDAVRYMRRKAKREWQEIEQIGRRESLSSLPETADQLIEDIEGGADVTAAAETLGATGSCSICGTTIVKADTFAEAATQHYGLTDPEATEAYNGIQQALWRSSVETGGSTDFSLCAYHDDRWDRD